MVAPKTPLPARNLLLFTNKKNGTGLGLSVCKMLVEEFEAKISFESELNKGTKFIIQFKPINLDLHE